jgi:hypothetical protein
MKQVIQANLQSAAERLIVGYKSVKAQEENLRLAGKVYEQTTMLYAEGLANLTDLLETEISLREAQVLHVHEVIRYKKTEIDMMKAEGILGSLLNK